MTTACSIANGLSFVTYSWLCPFIECERFGSVMRRFQEHESSGHIEVDLSCRIVHSMT